MDPTRLICDIGELNHLFKNSISIEHFLDQTVAMVSRHLETDVCSIYIYDEDDEKLFLKATQGLKRESVNSVELGLGEGLVGKAIKELRTLSVENATEHPDFKAFEDTDEEKFDNFLAVPIARGINRVGVLALQRERKHRFTEEDVVACRAVASQLANIIENAKFLISMHSPSTVKAEKKAAEKLTCVKGKSGSPGWAHGAAVVVDREKNFKYLSSRRYSKNYSIEEFHAAVKNTEQQLEELQNRVEEKLTDAASLIFASHLMILKDKEFIGTMTKLIENGVNPPQAIVRVAKEYMEIFEAGRNQYVREKVQDLEDLTVRLMGNLSSELESLANVEGKIVIAGSLFPSDLLAFSGEGAAGVVLVSGGVTSHLAILARSLQIPLVIANNSRLLDVAKGADLLLDADAGVVYIEPAEEMVKSFRSHQSLRQRFEQQKHLIRPSSATKDGTKVKLLSNVNLFNDARLANEMLSEGVGLYRTEFPFIIRSNFPSEEEQRVTYRRLVEEMAGKTLVFRTLDIGGDKVLSYYQNTREQNPFLGMRSIRFCLQNPDVFGQQIRAMLRAGVGADLRIMFPMISSVDEFIEAREFVFECARELQEEGLECNAEPSIGMMVELPSVVDLIDDFAQVSDFFSVGTNDFIQFMLGVDRTNENMAVFYLPHHPSVLRSLKRVASAANAKGKEVTVCGDMAHQRQYIRFLLGIGIRSLSVDPAYLLEIQQAIGEIDIEQAERHAEQVLSQGRISEVGKLLGE